MKYKGAVLPSVGHIVNRINYYAEPFSKKENVPLWRIYIDFAFSFLMTGCGAMDYFLYDFYFLNSAGKRKFMTVKQRFAFDYKHNSEAGIETLLDKEKTLKLFEKYIERDWCGCEFHNKKADYESFLKKHNKGIIKPQRGMGGVGVKIVDLRSYTPKQLYKECKKENAIIEEIVVQHSKMNSMYAGAVNTIRILTVRGVLIGAALRIGAGGGNVDNAHAGGIFTEIDLHTGVIICDAMNHKGEKFVLHPDTKTVIPGFRIPCWNECVELVKETSKLVPEITLIGWDIAISETGPTIIEVNHMPGLELVQAPAKHGIRKMIR